MREPFFVKELSIDMVMFLKHLYENGYFKDSKFGNVGERFDLAWFETPYALGYIKFAAVKFANDNLEIAKWLSASGIEASGSVWLPLHRQEWCLPCEKTAGNFEVLENTVCRKCMLRESCKFVNQNVWKCDANKLDLEIVM